MKNLSRELLNLIEATIDYKGYKIKPFKADDGYYANTTDSGGMDVGQAGPYDTEAKAIAQSKKDIDADVEYKGEAAEWKANHYYSNGDDLGSIEQKDGKWVAYSGDTELGKFDQQTDAKAAVEKAASEEAGDPGPSQKARHDKENMELAKITVDQVNMLKEINDLCYGAMQKAEAYGKWLEKEKVQVNLSKGAEALAKSINTSCGTVTKII